MTGSGDRVSILIDFSLSFVMISHIILTVILEKYILDRRTPQRVEIGVGSGWCSKVSCHLNYPLNLWSNLFFSNCTASINSYPVLANKLFSWYLINLSLLATQSHYFFLNFTSTLLAMAFNFLKTVTLLLPHSFKLFFDKLFILSS